MNEKFKEAQTFVLINFFVKSTKKKNHGGILISLGKLKNFSD